MSGPVSQQQQKKQTPIHQGLGHQDAMRMREQLLRMETWDMQGRTLDERLMQYGYQVLAQREENLQLTRQA